MDPVKYTCPRCGYDTIKSTNMERHFLRIKPCPARYPVVLTDEIKRDVLLNRVYHSTMDTGKSSTGSVGVSTTIDVTGLASATSSAGGTTSSHITINQHHNVINFIGQLNIYDKISKFLEYQDKSLCDLT